MKPGGMKMMKKTLALFLCVVMCLALFPAAYAEGEKSVPTAANFDVIVPETTYDGNGHPATVTVKDGVEGMGQVTVKYSTDGGASYSTDAINAGIYQVAIDVLEGENYQAATGITDNAWKFTISKATPTADIFSFTAPKNLTYDGNQKYAKVEFSNSGYLTGLGNVTVKYSADGGDIYDEAAPVNAGTYQVGIAVDSGTNFTGAELITNGGWIFTIVEPTYVAQIGETKYTTLTAAIAAVTESTQTTIKLLADITEGGGYCLGKEVNKYDTTPTLTQNITIDLNGHTITEGNGSVGSIFTIVGQSTLTIDDSSEGKAGRITSSSWRGFDVARGALTLNAGTISCSLAGWYGAGVNVWGTGEFVMNGGTISGCYSPSNGGGVYNAGTFTMNGGTITGNHAESDGGGVYNAKGTQMTVCGTASVLGNSYGSENELDNVWLMAGDTLTVENPAAGMSVGISMQNAGVFTSASADGYIGYFSSDDPAYKVTYTEDKKLQLESARKVTVSTSTNGTVTPDMETAVPGETVTLTVAPDTGYKLKTLKYTDSSDHSITADAQGAYKFAMPAEDVTVSAEFEAITLTGIAVTTAPAKTAYTEGETFDKTGMVVTATYSDGSTKAVIGYTVSPSGALATTDTSVTITYIEGSETKTATQAITVQASPAGEVKVVVQKGGVAAADQTTLLKTATAKMGSAIGTDFYDIYVMRDGAKVTDPNDPVFQKGISFELPMPSGKSTATHSFRLFHLKHDGAVEEITPLTVSSTAIQGTAFSLSPYLLASVPKNVTISASYEGYGRISPNGAVVVPYGGSQTFTFTPASANYYVGRVYVDGQNIGAPASYTFANVTGDHTLRVIFVDRYGNPYTGDDSSFGLWTALALLSLTAAGWAAVELRKKKNEK